MYRFTVEQYHRMIETGILTANDKVELVEGWIVEKMPHNPPHEATITRITRQLVRRLPDEWLLRVQSAITLPQSEPEPDFAIVAGPEDVYFKRHPVPRDIALVIEVADSTLLADRHAKARLYANARLAQYWIVNLVDSRIEVSTQPRAGKTPAYRNQRNYGKGNRLPLVLAGTEVGQIPVQDLLP